ncbi:YkgJ family cysteine cluster protein [Paucidesulfovibrio longus]|uniref:YkgJ family cysteine cluster protein n=1 Tax=Paucidesulfovibrio longus TaxID=889 RepID=UPI0003B5F170|nr:zinc/iron-chelating domain-containing protein [Paucidesulfovibrio longus]
MRSRISKKNKKNRSSASMRPAQGAALACAVPDVSQEELHEAFARRVTEDRLAAVSAALEEAPSVASLCRVVEESYGLFDELLADMDLEPPLACARGCSHCCYNQISLTPPEAIYLGLFVLEKYRGAALEQVHERLQTILDLIRGKSRTEIGTIRHLLPCPFLEDGACAVHSARPLVCRGWNSVNAEHCRRANDYQDPLTMIENHALPRLLAEAIQLGLLHGSRVHGLEAGFLVITRAVRLMLDHGVGECAADWLQGRPFFGRGTSW